MRCRSDARAAIHRWAVVITLASVHLSGMDGDSDPQGGATRHWDLTKGNLQVQGSGNRIGSSIKDAEQAVAFASRFDEGSLVANDGCSGDRVVALQRCGRSSTVLFPQRRAAFDIRQKECAHLRRGGCHRPISSLRHYGRLPALGVRFRLNWSLAGVLPSRGSCRRGRNNVRIAHRRTYCGPCVL